MDADQTTESPVLGGEMSPHQVPTFQFVPAAEEVQVAATVDHVVQVDHDADRISVEPQNVGHHRVDVDHHFDLIDQLPQLEHAHERHDDQRECYADAVGDPGTQTSLELLAPIGQHPGAVGRQPDRFQ